MDVEVRDVWRCPVDYLDRDHDYFRLGGKEPLTKRYRQVHQDSEYEVKRWGKFRPVVILGLDRATDRYLAAPVYSLHEGAKVVPLLQQQIEQKRNGKRRVYTLVKIQPSDVHPVTKAANEPGLTEVSVIRLDEVRAIPRRALDERMGRLPHDLYRKLVAGYLHMAWHERLPDFFDALGV